MKTNSFQNRTSMIKIFACFGALVIITLMSSCAKAKVEGAVKLTNVFISKFAGDKIKITTEGKNLVMISKVGHISEETKADTAFRNSKIEYLKHDSTIRYVTEDLIPLCKEADYEYFVLRYMDTLSSDTMNILIPLEEF